MEVVESDQRVEHEKPQLSEDATVAKDGTLHEHDLLEVDQVVEPVSKDEVQAKVCLLQPEDRGRDVLNTT